MPKKNKPNHIYKIEGECFPTIHVGTIEKVQNLAASYMLDNELTYVSLETVTPRIKVYSYTNADGDSFDVHQEDDKVLVHSLGLVVTQIPVY